MRAQIDPELESTVSRTLQVLHSDPRAQPWPSPVARVEGAVRRQNRRRASMGAVVLAVLGSATAVGITAVGGARRANEPAGGTIVSVPATARATAAPLALPSAGQRAATANASAAIVVPPAALSKVSAMQASHSAAFAAAEARPADTTPIPASKLPALRSLAWHQADVWGDPAATITAVHLADSTALSAALGNFGTPALDIYALEIRGILVCRGCRPPGMSALPIPAYYEYVDAHTLRETFASYGGQSVDLARYGVVSTIAPLDASATPRPIGPTLTPFPPGHQLTEPEARLVALQGADDPTTATVLWTATVTNARLKTLKNGQQGGDDLRFYVVAVSGPRTSEFSSLTRWAAIIPMTGSAEATTTCGPDFCGVKAPS